MRPSDHCDDCHDTGAAKDARRALLTHSLRLEYATLGWNTLEGALAIVAAVGASSVALLGFGIDSVVEVASSGILVWRLRAERRDMDVEAIERMDRRALRLVGGSLFLLAAYILVDSVVALWVRTRPETSVLGIAVTAAAIPVMLVLSRAKRRAAARLASRALAADSFQTSACMWLSLVALVGTAANAIVGWWWADSVAAIAMTYFLVAEGREAWRGEVACCATGCNPNG